MTTGSSAGCRGGINTIANLLQGDELSRSRALRTLDFMFVQDSGQDPGFWYGCE